MALPTLRANFVLDADTAAWASMGYSLPFMALMPLYGRLGDGLGKRRLLLVGTLMRGAQKWQQKTHRHLDQWVQFAYNLAIGR